MEKTHIVVDNLQKSFTQKGDQGTFTQEVLKGISVSFEQGQSYAIVGASGSGKSTLLHLLSGLDTPTSGEVFFNTQTHAQNINKLSPTARAHFLQQSLGLVFQLPYLIRELSVLENVMIKALVAGTPVSQSAYDYTEFAQELLVQVGLADKIHARPSTLSGGQQQRVALARALLTKPAFLLADEPTGNLDQETGTAIIDMLLDYHHRWGMGLIISSHDPYVAGSMTHILTLKSGLLV